MKKDGKLTRTILNSILPVILAFVLGGFIILAIGENPLETYGILIRKSLFTAKGFLNTLHYASPLILTGLAIAVTFKANIYNMGVEGQMLLGGFFAGIAGISSQYESCASQTALLRRGHSLRYGFCPDSGAVKGKMQGK